METLSIERAPINPELRQQLKNHVYPVIGCIQNAHSNLGPGMPEYIYQEALTTELTAHGFLPEKEYQHHPIYRGQTMASYLKMDVMIPMEQGNVIVECKAIMELGEKERYQLYGYLRGTEFPIGILVNFGTWPKAQVERYYYDRVTKVIRAF